MGGIGCRFDEIVERAGGGLGVVAQRRQPALLVGAHAQRLPGGGAVPDGAEHLLSPQHQLDRAADEAGGHDAEDLRPLDQPLRPEAAAEERAADVDALGRNAEQPGDASLCHRHALARRVDGQGVAVPRRHDGVGLQRVVVLRRRFVDRLDPNRRCRKPGLDVAMAILGRHAGADIRGREAVVRIQASARRLGLVTRGQQDGTLGRGLQRVRHHDGDWLVGVAHLVILQHVHPEHERIVLRVRIHREPGRVRGRHHLDYAGVRLGRGHVERGDPAAGDAADGERGIDHAGRVVVGGIACGASGLQHAFAPGQRLADVRPHADMRGRLRNSDLRHG